MRLFDLWSLLCEDPPALLRWDLAADAIFIGSDLCARVENGFMRLAQRVRLHGCSGWIPLAAVSCDEPDMIVRLIHKFSSDQGGHDVRVLH